jgi:dCMP deaminase
LSPCYSCAQLIINAGLTRVVFDRGYRDHSGIHLLYDAKIAVITIRENA